MALVDLTFLLALLLPGLRGSATPIRRLFLIREYTSWWLRPKSLQWPVLGVDHGKDHWEHSNYQKGTHQKGTLILSKGTLILSKGTLILSKRNSSKRNTHIIKRNTHIIK